MAVISSTAWWGLYGSEYSDFRQWSEQSTGIKIFDVSDASTPDLSWEFETEGAFVTSRLIDNMAYFIVRHSPVIQDLIPYPVLAADNTSNDRVIEQLSIDDVLPKATINGEAVSLLNTGDCLVVDPEHELAPEQRGNPVLTTIVAIDIDNARIADVLCFNEATYGSYVSANAIYLLQPNADNSGSPQTLIHRFSLNQGLEYSGSGEVTGNLWTSGNEDFRISEYDDYLRVVTTTWTGGDDRFDHQLHILNQAENGIDLETIATLPNDRHPEPIGKPNEDLYGVRFFEDIAYLVTFETIDPLYVIDLSDPLDPVIAGELNVTGFSDFLHPVSDDLLLGLGQDEQNKVKLELFNVGNISQPFSLGSLSIDAAAISSYSEARWNRHAFTYLADINGVDRFAVPLQSTFFSEANGYSNIDSLHLFELRDKESPLISSLIEVGDIQALPQNNTYYGSDNNRSVFHDDAVFYIHGSDVWSALWTNLENQMGPAE